jgi:3-oxoacyl-[acyl-carrier protein] reductase
MDGRTVVVTGASRGLGAAIARAFALAGAYVLINYRLKQSQAEALRADIAAAGGLAESLPFDVRDGGAAADALAGVVERRGGVDVLVNNAGVVSDNVFTLMEETQWRAVIDTNLHGVYNCTRAVVPDMVSRKAGTIINVASVAAVRPSPGQANYAASKGGVVSLTKTLAAELAPKGIRVNAIVPGLIQAGMTTRLNREIADVKRAMIPMRRFGTPEDISAAALFLGSDKAAYITGQTWVIDGGLTC